MNKVHLSVIIPSWTGEVSRLRRSLAAQTYQDFETIVVRGVSPAGRARNQGVAQARGELILFIDDDAFFGHERVLERMVAILESDDSIGVVGPARILPDGANWLQRRIAAQVPRAVIGKHDADLESNPPVDRHGFTGITTTCCVLRRRMFEQLDGFAEDLQTGEDPEFFYRVRRAGYRFMMPGGCWVDHDLPGTVRAMLRKSFGYGRGHGYQARRNPERNLAVVPLNRWYGKLFLIGSPLLIVPSMFVSYVFEPTPGLQWGVRPVKALSTFATLWGYAYGWYQFGARPAVAG
jgi:glycosyltransferase involved in cell wall biosynthesis